MSADISDTQELTPDAYIASTERTPILARIRQPRYKSAITMFVLFLINLLNYMDRFAIAGVLDKIQKYFNISDSKGGLLQTVFICSYMALAPLFGYLGDRYSRKTIILLGVSLWSITTLAGSFVPPHLFSVFVLLRSLVGVGEASYSCVSPTIIGDLYKDDLRTKMLALFNIAVPLGSGLGYIIGSNIALAFNDWRWALRITPILGIICVILLLFLVSEPVRGSADGAPIQKASGWLIDVKELIKIKSYILSSLAFTWVAFTLGAVSWWAPNFLKYASQIANHSKEEKNVALYFGIVTCFAGITGVTAGTEIARRYRKVNPSADPIVCGWGILGAMPFLFIVLVFSHKSIALTWICIFLAETLMCFNWALISDMLLYIVIPTRRSTAAALQIFASHLLGDATSPYIVGLMSDYFRKDATDTLSNWVSLRNALMICPFVATLGGAAFLFCSLYIVEDRRKAALIMEMSANDDDQA